VKLRLPGRRDDADQSVDAGADGTVQLTKGSGKGRPTPKRTEAQGRRSGPPPPPPTTRKEAYRRTRATQAANRGPNRAAAARGVDDALPARDRGPVRKLVRDVVDSRRNMGPVLLIAAVFLFVVQFTHSAVTPYLTAVFAGALLLFAVDAFVLTRAIRKSVGERFPDSSTRGLAYYGISRSTMIRRWRFPQADPAITGRPAAQD
jgi:hypothetical protein